MCIKTDVNEIFANLPIPETKNEEDIFGATIMLHRIINENGIDINMDEIWSMERMILPLICRLHNNEKLFFDGYYAIKECLKKHIQVQNAKLVLENAKLVLENAKKALNK